MMVARPASIFQFTFSSVLSGRYVFVYRELKDDLLGNDAPIEVTEVDLVDGYGVGESTDKTNAPMENTSERNFFLCVKCVQLCKMQC